MYKVGDVVVLTKDVKNGASAYDKYFSDTKGIMPKGTRFKVIALREDLVQPVRVRLLINDEEILQTGGIMNSYSSLHSYEIRLESKTLSLLKALKDM